MTTKQKMTAALVAAAMLAGGLSTNAFTAPLSAGTNRAGVHLKQGTLFLTKDVRSLEATTAVLGDQAALYLLQVSFPVQQQYVTTLQSMGVEIGNYLPDNAYLVRMKPQTRAAVAKLSFVTGLQHFEAKQKLDPSLAQAQQATVRVLTFDGSLKAVGRQLSAMGVKVQASEGTRLTVETDAAGLQQLAASENVVYVEPVRKNQLLNDKAAPVIAVDKMWNAGYDGSGQVVAITDTGLDNGVDDSTMHPDFQGQIKQLTALGRPGDASDTMGHGTHVAGSVLGTGKASNGQYKGMAPGAKLVFQSVADSKGGLGGIPDNLTALFDAGYKAGARIHSNSWGVPAGQGGTIYDAQSQSVDQYMWDHPDYTILFAAGNDGDQNQDGTTDYSTVSTPGTAKNAITVGASQNNRPDQAKLGDDVNKIASFSSRGPTGDGRVKPDIVAPGTWILSTKSRKADDKEFWKGYSDMYAYMGGTSMATPLTAGAVADLRQYFVQKVGVTPMASLLKASLINGAVNLGEGQDTRDQGWGRINLANSVLGGNFQYVNEAKALATDGSASYTYHADGKAPVKLTLVWTDFPADPNANKTLVNDLDLTVTGPDGKAHTGNESLDQGVDHTNNVEQVNLPATAGDYTVAIKGYNVPKGPQKFALVVSGVTGNGTPPQTPPTNPTPTPTPPADKEAPKTAVTAPTQNAVVRGQVSVTASATDNVSVTQVDLLVDGTVSTTLKAAPWTFVWDSTRVGDGAHTLAARARDAAGNVTTGSPINVTVSNASPTGPLAGMTFTGHVDGAGLYGSFVEEMGAGPASAHLDITSTDGTTPDIAILVFDSQGNQVATADGATSVDAAWQAKGGTYNVLVYRYAGAADYTLKTRHAKAAGMKLEGVSGKVDAASSRFASYYVTMSRRGVLNASVSWTGQGDLDLYLLDAQGNVVTSATSPNLNPETLSKIVDAGRYTLVVAADSGAGSFQLQAVYP